MDEFTKKDKLIFINDQKPTVYEKLSHWHESTGNQGITTKVGLECPNYEEVLLHLLLNRSNSSLGSHMTRCMLVIDTQESLIRD